MQQLFTTYSARQIILFLIILAFAIKESVSFLDWTKKRTKEAVEASTKPIEAIQKQQEEIENMKKILENMANTVKLLVRSDRDVLRHTLTKDHHYFCYKLKSIDDYSLDCMEKQYENYKEQGGNSFIDSLMEDIRKLPRKIEINNR